MKRNVELENILEECLERLLTGGQTIEQCLGDYPEWADELKPLLDTALLASRAREIQPRPDFKARARYEFQAALGKPVRPSRFLAAYWPRWANVVAAALVLLVAGGGMVAAAESSMPDDTLYPVKLATEQVRLAFTFSDVGKATLYVELTDRRVNEIDDIVQNNKLELVEETTERLNESLTAVAQYASDGEDNGGMLMLAPASEATQESADAPLPISPGDKFRDTGAGDQSTGINATDTDSYGQDEDLNRLRILVARYAVKHPAKLRQMLETAPGSIRPALEQALAIAEARYHQALEAIDREQLWENNPDNH